MNHAGSSLWHRLRRVRHPILDFLGERMARALGIFVATWLVGGLGFYLIGRWYGLNREAVLPDGTVDNLNFGLQNCLYLAAMTVSTLGMADVGMLNRLPPDGGRTVLYDYTMGYALVSYVFVVYATAQIVGYVVEGALGHFLEKRRMERDLKATSGHYVVCGLGSTGRHIVDELVKVEKDVVGVDVSLEHVMAMRRDFPGALFMEGDATVDEVLEKSGVARAAGIFCATPNDKDNIIMALSARQLNANIRVVSRASDPANTGKMQQVGSQAIVSPNRIGGLRMASEMIRPAATTFLDTMLRSQGGNTRFDSVTLRAGAAAAQRTLGELAIQDKLGLVVVATVGAGGEIRYNPAPETRMAVGDSLVVIATPAQKASLEAALNG